MVPAKDEAVGPVAGAQIALGVGVGALGEAVGRRDEQQVAVPEGEQAEGVLATLVEPPGLVVEPPGQDEEARVVVEGRQEGVDVRTPCRQLESVAVPDGGLVVDAGVQQVALEGELGLVGEGVLGADVDDPAGGLAVADPVAAGQVVHRLDEVSVDDRPVAPEVVDDGNKDTVDVDVAVFGVCPPDDQQSGAEGSAGRPGQVLDDANGVAKGTGNPLDLLHGEGATGDVELLSAADHHELIRAGGGPHPEGRGGDLSLHHLERLFGELQVLGSDQDLDGSDGDAPKRHPALVVGGRRVGGAIRPHHPNRKACEGRAGGEVLQQQLEVDRNRCLGFIEGEAIGELEGHRFGSVGAEGRGEAQGLRGCERGLVEAMTRWLDHHRVHHGAGLVNGQREEHPRLEALLAGGLGVGRLHELQDRGRRERRCGVCSRICLSGGSVAALGGCRREGGCQQQQRGRHRGSDPLGVVRSRTGTPRTGGRLRS